MIELGEAPADEVRRKASRTKIVDGLPDISRRSVLAFLKSHKEATETPTSVFIEHATKLYVALVMQSAVAAIYRVRNDLQLKRMRRIPEPVVFAAELFRRETLQ